MRPMLPISPELTRMRYNSPLTQYIQYFIHRVRHRIGGKGGRTPVTVQQVVTRG